MPENETLIHDGRTVSRWRPLRERLDGGLEPTEAFPAIQNEFYAWLQTRLSDLKLQPQNVWRQWKGRGVDPADLFAAALNAPNLLGELIRQARFDRNARLLRDVAAGLQDADMEGLIGAFLDAAWDSAHGQLQLDCREDTLSPEFMNRIQGMLGRIRQSLLNNRHSSLNTTTF